MARSSPGVARVVAILDFIAEHPGQAFTLTDLVRALKLSRATCHALLAGLVEAGYLYRSGDKSYVLGPRLARIGRAAELNFSPLQAAQPEMRALADEFDAVCSAMVREGDDVVVRERAASRSHLGWSLPRDGRMPLRPPFAGIFLAWSPGGEAMAWADQLEPAVEPEFREQMLRGMAFAREHGFQLVLTNPRAPEELSTAWFFGEGRREPPVCLAEDLVAEKSYPITSMSAPVFEAGRRVAFVLSLTSLNGPAMGADIARIGQRLTEACRRISGFAGGEAHGSAAPAAGAGD